MVVMSLLGFSLLASVDPPPARADFTFGAPVDVQSAFPLLDFAQSDGIACFSADGLEVYTDTLRAGGQGNDDIWVCKRASPEDDWGPPENLGPLVNSAGFDVPRSLTADGLELYFYSWRSGSGDIYVIKRATRNSPWGPATKLGAPVNSSYVDWGSVSSDGLELYFHSDRPGGYGGFDFYVSRRATRNDPWGDPNNLGSAVNSPGNEASPVLSPDGLLLVFQDDGTRPGGYGGGDLWMTRRASRSAPWQPPVNLGPMVNGPNDEFLPCFAPDGSALYIDRGDNSTYTYTQWKAPILPIVDFNADGKVDLDDLRLLIDNWGTDKTLYDIGPYAWGDGKVDIEDLKVFTAEWEKQITTEPETAQ
jgi:Tol biopolymer transport system component